MEFITVDNERQAQVWRKTRASKHYLVYTVHCPRCGDIERHLPGLKAINKAYQHQESCPGDIVILYPVENEPYRCESILLTADGHFR